MRNVWILEHDVPNIPRLQAHGIDGTYLDPRDPWVTRANLKNLEAAGFKVGIYGAWNWAEAGSPENFASWMAAQVERLTDGASYSATFPRVQFDIEVHDPGYVRACLEAFRRFFPNQATSWTLEGMQGGWMSKEFVAALLATRVRVVPQYYTGAMKPMAADRCAFDLLDRGIPRTSISGFYDAAALPEWWDGFAYHQGRLPT